MALCCGKLLSALTSMMMVAILCVPAWSQESPTAVGRISYGIAFQPGAAICTGALVASDLVLTAAHCVRSFVSNPSAIRFDAGLNKGQVIENRRGAKVVLPETPAEASDPISSDAALVVLDEPIPADRVTPLAVADPESEYFTMVAYRRDSPEIPYRTDMCDVLAAEQGRLALTCPVVSGNSGAPLLHWNGAYWEVTAIMVASDIGPARSWAIQIPLSLLKRINADP